MQTGLYKHVVTNLKIYAYTHVRVYFLKTLELYTDTKFKFLRLR